MTPEAVLFDYGGVFTESPFAAARRAFERLGIDPVQGHEWIFGSYEVDTAHPWHRLERGETSAQAARDEICLLYTSRWVKETAPAPSPTTTSQRWRR